jgi:hypothetical protein
VTIGQLYVKVCSQYNREANEDQAHAWKSVLGEYQTPVVESAICIWQSNLTPAWDGRPIGAMFPTPADVKAIVELEKSKQTGTFTACYQDGCEDGWIRLTVGRTVGNASKPEGCPIDEKVGAVKRCECWWLYLCGAIGCSRHELRSVLKQRESKGRNRN